MDRMRRSQVSKSSVPRAACLPVFRRSAGRQAAPGTLLLCLAAIALLPAWASADSLWIRPSSEKGKPLEIPRIQILRTQDELIFFKSISGNESSRQLAQVLRIALDDEPALNAAEEAYADEKWDAAVDGYQKTLKSTGKAWLKDWVGLRLLESASKSHRFDAAVTAYIAILLKNPDLAAKYRPALPDKDSAYLSAAISDVKKALADTKLPDVPKQALLGFLLDLYRAKGDTDAAAQVSQQMIKLNPGQGSGSAAVQSSANAKLSLIRLALDQKDYAKVLADIQASGSLFTDPAQQADALFYVAQAREGLLAGSSDAKAVKDAGLAYMRVVTMAKDLPGKPHVAESLLRTAALHEKLREPQTALQLYEQIAVEFKGSPTADKASEESKRLRGATKSSPAAGN